MSRFEVLTDYNEQKRHIEPILKTLNSSLPAPGNAVIFAEFDDKGEVVAFQVLQQALMAEGLWARDHHAHLRKIWNMMREWLGKHGVVGRDLFVIASTPKIGRACELMGCEEMKDWQLFRRQF